jgi:hypothetical protein
LPIARARPLATLVLAYGPGGGYEPLRAWLAPAMASTAGSSERRPGFVFYTEELLATPGPGAGRGTLRPPLKILARLGRA